MAIRVAVDAMGGDNAPEVIIDGALRALDTEEVHITLVGPSDRLEAALDDRNVSGRTIEILDAPQHIGMDEAPATAVKQKRRSSIHIGLQAQKNGHADAFVSAGNTGAIMAASLFILGRIPNIVRPTVIGSFPTLEGTALVLDVGANVDCRPDQLVQFARMGALYVEHILDRKNPSVGLMNVGEEPGKGNEAVKGAYELLDGADNIYFVGNVEGGDIMYHAADVVVCDGFVGNILLKFGESLPDVFTTLMGREMKRQEIPGSQQEHVKQLIQDVRQRFNYEEYGGSPLLGVNGTVFVGHGCSTPRAVQQLVLSAVNAARNDLTGVLSSTFAPNDTPV
jgi:glycerol-3-phosphate acyltransferase PlsX